ncbi:hypothetical protein [Novosphingobium sp.]|uniref:hypothetical protein n=1 Tax=Novosphingobium sp. TaxID=1874826 RepID=UPI0035B2A79C
MTSGTANRSGIGAGDFAAALAWWRLAGVDHDYCDESRGWLAADEPEPQPAVRPQFEAPAPPPPEPAPRIGGEAHDLPQDLAAFTAWWMSEPSLDSGQVTGRVPPRGPAGAALMVLVDHPEADDGARLLSAAHGRLLGGILSALGLGEDEAYVASALPRFMPLPDWAGLRSAGLAEIVARHVVLAAPQRLLVMGSHVSSLLGHDPTKSAESLRRFNHEGVSIPWLAAPGLADLLARPKRKARLWQDLLALQTT